MTDMLDALDASGGALHIGQWRLAEIQVANWGTFDGAIYRFPISRKGHLITGPSGSGKSSLLDAIAVVLTPDKWLRLNAAAQGGGVKADQRNRMSYVRGAWSRTTDEHEDRVVSAFLRPKATWSGIVLRFENAVDKPVTLGRVFFAKGSSTALADLADLCLIDRADFDLRDIEPFVGSGIETRKIQQQWPDALVTTNGSHGKFYARLRTLFGIPHDEALQLLHKTQSAKTLDSLDQLFRDYMLDQPGTFELADTAVAQFGELRDAHDHVVQMRQQRDHLLRLRDESERLDAAAKAAQAARALGDAVDPYQRRRMLALASEELAETDERLIQLRVDADQAITAARRATDEHDLAQQRRFELGGGDAEQLEVRIREAEERGRDATLRLQAFTRQLAAADVDRAPTSSTEFAELMTQIDRMLKGGGQDAPGPTWQEQDRLSQARRELRTVESALEALKSGTTVPENLLAVREELCRSTGLNAAVLPFGAELIDVRAEFEEWTGAIERVLRPLALTMLVRTEHLAAVRRWVDAHRVRARLVFEEVTGSASPPAPARHPDSLVNRVLVAEGSFGAWLVGTLSERFDVVCVEQPDELDAHLRAVTLNGQVKSSRTRYEKDDRVRLDDRAHWVLGDSDAKREALVDQRHTAEQEVEHARAIVERATAHRDGTQKRLGTMAGVREYSWHDIDTSAAARAVSNLRRSLAELTRGDGDLQAAMERAHTTRALRDTAVTAREDANLALRQNQERREELQRVVRGIDDAISSGVVAEVDEPTARELDGRFRALQRRLTRTTIGDVAQQVRRSLGSERDAALDAQHRASNAVQRLVTEFSDRWSAAVTAADLTPSIGDRQGYLDLLDQILAHGLPEYEARFLQLLRDRSRELIGELVSDILAAPREIEERVLPVNASLRRSPFDAGTFLRLRVKVRRSETVTRFIKDLQSIAEGSWGEDDHATAEKRFETLAELMRRFASSEHVDRVWRAQCLDTRLHVTFRAVEVDEHDRERAAYDSGAAMSGGQQQKLVVFCLAAAVRYRLSDADDERTSYGTIVLDEAFDKADSRYTRMALDIFEEFGFQLVLATPQKLLQTIEPYVGAATQIENPSRRRSQIVTVTWRDEDAS